MGMKPSRKEIAVRLGLIGGATFFSLIVGLLILEVALRLLYPLSLFSPLLPLRPQVKMTLHPRIQGLSPMATFSTNKWGFRGDGPPADWSSYYTIVTIGGSTTQCMYVDDHKTWPYLLQKELEGNCPTGFGAKCPHVWVGNGGLDGQSARAHVLFMEEVIPKIKPDMVIVLAGINDLSLEVFGDPQHFQNPSGDLSLPMRLYLKSRVFQTLYLWKLILWERVTVANKYRHANWVPQPLVGAMKLPLDLKELLPTLPEYRHKLRKIIEKGKELKVRLLFLTHPMLFADTEYWRSVEGAPYFHWLHHELLGKLSAATYWKLLELYNQEMLAVCREEGVECFDLAAAVPHSPEFLYDVCHFTERGCQLVASQVAAYLRQHDGPALARGPHP
jgi:lysophospholipase L1-like esterase